jgi:hypothetical protein
VSGRIVSGNKPKPTDISSGNKPELTRSKSDIVCLAWNAEGLANFGRELALANLATTTGADIVVISEAELKPDSATFEMDGYTTFSLLTEPGGKTRVLVLVKTVMATECNAVCRTDLMSPEVSSVWNELGHHTRRVGGREVRHGPLLFAGVYRQWEDDLGTEKAKVAVLFNLMVRATSGARRVALMGDINLDALRRNDRGYYRRALLNEFTTAAEGMGFYYLQTEWTWQSHGRFPSSTPATTQVSPGNTPVTTPVSSNDKSALSLSLVKLAALRRRRAADLSLSLSSSSSN